MSCVGGLITMDAMDLVRQPDVLEQAIQNVDKVRKLALLST
jgi:hypothetical protein